MPVSPTPHDPGIYIQEVPSGVHTIHAVPTSTTAFIGRARQGPVDEPTLIRSFGEFERVFGGLWAESQLGYAVSDFFLNGGSDALIVRVQAVQPAEVKGSASAADGQPLAASDVVGSQADQTGLYALEKADIFNLLVIPPFEQDQSAGSGLYTVVVPWALVLCQKRRAILVLDPPADWTDEDQAREGLRALVEPHANAALYFPRIKKADPLKKGRISEFAPGGAIAGVIARTDLERGVWKAPAGLEASLNGVVELSVQLTDAQNGQLNPLGINCLCTMPAAGHVVWGARTLEGDDRLDSQWKYLPVRRTTLFIEESLYRGTRWAVYEPNDEPLWAQLRLNIGAFLHDLFRQGAFQGQSPKDAYFVKCDGTTTTQADVDRGIVNIVVGFAPLKPAEFVVLTIQQAAGNLSA